MRHFIINKARKNLITIYNIIFRLLDSIMNPNGKELDQSVRVEFQYFIELAVQKKLEWNTLVHFLTDLAPTLDKSRQVIRILVQELEKWVTKVENEIEEEIIAPNDIAETKESKDLILHGEISLATSEMPDSEDESNVQITGAMKKVRKIMKWKLISLDIDSMNLLETIR